jgi:multidrug efflux pump
VHRGYEKSLDWALRLPLLMVIVFLATIGLSVYMYIQIPKGFFPQQDTGRLIGGVRADQSISFQAMRQKLDRLAAIVMADPAVENVTAFTGGGQRNRAQMFVALKAIKDGRDPVDKVMARIRLASSKEPGANLFLSPIQDLRGGRAPGRRLDPVHAARRRPERAAHLGRPPERRPEGHPRAHGRELRPGEPRPADDAGDRPGDRLAPGRVHARHRLDPRAQRSGSRSPRPSTRTATSTRVIMEAAPDFTQSPETLQSIYVLDFDTPAARQARHARPGSALADRALRADARAALGEPPGDLRRHHDLVQTWPRGWRCPRPRTSCATPWRASACRPRSTPRSRARRGSSSRGWTTQPYLILAALLTVYIVLGILYESTVHPITILSTLPSAGVGRPPRAAALQDRVLDHRG